MTPRSDSAEHSDGQTALFGTTHWSVVLAAGQADSPQGAEALERLCRTYWYPVYAFVRRHGHSPADAQDLTQEFFARLLQKGLLHKVRPERGKFRWYLLAALRHFLTNEWDRARAEKRGGRLKFVPLDEAEVEGRYAQEPSQEPSAERIYDRTWALTMLELVRTRLREEFQARGKSQRFDLLEKLLPGANGHLNYAEAAGLLGLTEAGVKSEVHRFRRRFGELLRAETAHTVADPADIDGELQYLIEVMSNG